MSCPALQPWGEEWSVAARQGELHIKATAAADSRLIILDGVLDGVTYAPLRDVIVKAALDEPPAVIVDVTDLSVRDDPAWAVFTSVRWQIAEWPDIPIGLVCAHDHGRNALHRNGITRYVPVHQTLDSAVAEIPADESRRYRRRARAVLPAAKSSTYRCRELTAQWLTAWSRSDFIRAASSVASEMVEMALLKTPRNLSLRLEADGSTVAVAVQHAETGEASRQKGPCDTVSSLDLVAANSRVWGSYTSATGHTVWAVVGPENRF